MEAHVTKTRWPYTKRRPVYSGYTMSEYPIEEEIEDIIETQTEATSKIDNDPFKSFKRKYIQSDNDEESNKSFREHVRHIDEAQYSVQNLIDNILRSNVEVNTDESSSRRVKMNVGVEEPNNTGVIIDDNLDITSDIIYTDKTNENKYFSFQDNTTNANNYDGIDLIYSIIGDVQSDDHTSSKTFIDILSPIAKLTNESNNLGFEIIAENVTVENSSNVNNFKIKEVNDDDFINHSDHIIDRKSSLSDTMS